MPKTKRTPLPFHTDLNGYERVTRPFARKAWIWGLPVWQDYGGKGAVRLLPPDGVPECGDSVMFDVECLMKAGYEGHEDFTDAIRRKCVYLVPSGEIEARFADTGDTGCPEVLRGTAADLVPKVRRAVCAVRYPWRVRSEVSDERSVALYRLENSRDAIRDMFHPHPVDRMKSHEGEAAAS